MTRSFVVMFTAAALATAAPAAAIAADMPCASDAEARGFTLRHLQSQLMVAALSCNQKEAYNTFVQHFIDDLSAGGQALISYFDRTGGGAAALNRHVTELANAAGLHRAADPGFCAATWRMFWDLQQRPEKLADIAGANLMPSVSLPRSCSSVQQAATARALANKSTVPQEAKAGTP